MHLCSIYAHRGVSSEFLENTRSAFDRAVEIGVDGIETDVQISRDGVSVLWHDEALGLLGLPDSRVGTTDFSALCDLQFSAYGRVRDHETGLVRLEEFLPRYAPSCKLILEVKNLDWDRTTGRHRTNIEQCLAAAKRFAGLGPDSGVVVSSFDLDSLLRAHALEPAQSLVYNLDEGFRTDELKRALDEHAFFCGYCLPIGDLNAEASRLIHEQGKSLIVFTCNTPEQIRKAFDLGVDILISDFPQRAMDLRG